MLNKWCTKTKRKEILKTGQIIKTNWGVDGGIHRVNSVWHCGPITHTLKRDCLFSSIHVQLLIDIHKLRRNSGSFLYLWKTAPQLGKVSRCLFNSGLFFFRMFKHCFLYPLWVAFTVQVLTEAVTAGYDPSRQLTFKFSFISSSSLWFYSLHWFDFVYNLF